MNKRDTIPILFFLAAGLIVLIQMVRLPVGTFRQPGTAFFPILLTILLLLLTVVLLIGYLRRKVVEQGSLFGEYPKKIIPALGGLVLYGLLLTYLGFLLSTTLVLILYSRLAQCSWKAALTISVVCSVLSYFFFRGYLKSPLPQGILPF